MKKLIILFAIALLGLASCATNSPKDNSQPITHIDYIPTKTITFDDAIQYYEKQLATNPNDAVTYYNLGILYDENADNPAKAIFCYNKYLELTPADAPDREKVKQWIDNCQKRLGKR